MELEIIQINYSLDERPSCKLLTTGENLTDDKSNKKLCKMTIIKDFTKEQEEEIAKDFKLIEESEYIPYCLEIIRILFKFMDKLTIRRIQQLGENRCLNLFIKNTTLTPLIIKNKILLELENDFKLGVRQKLDYIKHSLLLNTSSRPRNLYITEAGDYISEKDKKIISRILIAGTNYDESILLNPDYNFMIDFSNDKLVKSIIDNMTNNLTFKILQLSCPFKRHEYFLYYLKHLLNHLDKDNSYFTSQITKRKNKDEPLNDYFSIFYHPKNRKINNEDIDLIKENLTLTNLYNEMYLISFECINHLILNRNFDEMSIEEVKEELKCRNVMSLLSIIKKGNGIDEE